MSAREEPEIPSVLAEARECKERAFSLHDTTRVWWVSSGYVDVFGLAKDAGARRHVLRVPAGGALFSLPPAPEESRLIGVLGPDARVMEADIPLSAELSHLVDFWVGGISSALGQTLMPQNSHSLQADDAIELQPGEIACAARQVTWIRVEGGSATYLETARSLGPADAPVPLTRQTWIKATEACRLRAVDTATVFSDGGAEAALSGFHALVLARLAEERRHVEQADIELTRVQADAERQAVDSAVLGLAAIMQTQDAVEVVRAAADDPLFAACRMVGQAAGVEVKSALKVAGPADALGDISRTSHFQTRRVTLRGDWWRRDNGPLLGYLKTEDSEDTGRNPRGSPVAILPVSPTRCVFIDPLVGARTPVSAASAARLSPVAFQFYRPFPRIAMTPWKLLEFALRGCRRDLVVTALMGVGSGALGLFAPIVTGLLINQVIPAADRPQVLTLGMGLLVVTLATSMFEFTRAVAAQRIEGKMDNVVQAAVWDRILALPTSFFRRYSAGDLANRAMSIDSMRQSLTGATVSAILGAIFSLFSVALMFHYNVGLAFLALIPLLGLTVFTVLAGLFQIRLELPLLQSQGRISGLVLQLLTGIAKIRVAGAEARAFARWGREFACQKRYAWQSTGVSNNMNIVDSMFSIAAAMLLFIGVSHTPRGDPSRMSPGDFLAFYAAFGQCTSALLALGSALTATLLAVPLFERARPILEALPEVSELRPNPGALRGEVELSHVSFRYGEDGRTVLQDVTLRADPGEFVAVVGPSGSGKSTVFRLLLGLETPESGAVYFDGQDLQNIDVQAVRRQMGVVLQNSKLMPGSIFENIVGSGGKTLEDAWEAARLAGLEPDIKAMPMGMHTMIMEGGGAFSGGQRQRLLIARALVNRPRILLFDEATSALDSETQEAVTGNLETLRATQIVIAHRLSTIRQADRIYVLVAGKIVQSGTYDELVGQAGPFEDLVRPQLLGAA